jgi:hypothetical protein
VSYRENAHVLEKTTRPGLLRRIWLLLTLAYWRTPKAPAVPAVDPLDTLTAENAILQADKNDITKSKRLTEALLQANDTICDATLDGLYQARVALKPALVGDGISGGERFHDAFIAESKRRGFEIEDLNKYTGTYLISWRKK